MAQFIEPLQFGRMTGTEWQKDEDTVQGSDGTAIFRDIFQNVTDMVNKTEKEMEEKQYLLATGQLDQPHELTAAVAEAQLSVELLVQMRNKALDAYNELMRIGM